MSQKKQQNIGKFAEIAIFRPLRSSYLYTIPDTYEVETGSLVEIPFGRTKIKGIILKIHKALPKPVDFKLKDISFIYPIQYTLPKNLLELAKWMSTYYIHPIGDILQSFSCSNPLKKQSEINEEKTDIHDCHIELREPQKKALNQITNSELKPSLLHGITGSGKTEVYMHKISECLNAGKSCLYLLPEITLTRETMRKLEKRFSPIHVFHSALTPKQRRETWLACKSKQPVLIVGARSALFSPVENLGLIVVDEEHDSSFKQNSNPRYHARDVAVVRAKFESAQVILGSATPSLETYHNAVNDKYTLIEMHQRISPHPLPEVQVVNLIEEKQELKRKSHIHFSRSLILKTRQILSKKKQAVFLLNRRGHSTIALCPACGEKIECNQCSIPLTFYKKKNLLQCHHCELQTPPPNQCPSCHHKPIIFRGTGTEKIHDLLQDLFPSSNIVRVDGSNESTQEIQDKVKNFMLGEGDILLGTQIIAKGLDSPNIQLSVAINADLGLNLPDFRSAERDFQLLTQLAGRSGRGDIPGMCIFQSSEPEHYAIRHSVQQNFKAFYHEELQYRHQLGYPPYKRIARVVFSSHQETKLVQTLKKHGPIFRSIAQKHHIDLLGPAPAPLEKIKNQFRWQILIKSQYVKPITHFLEEITQLFDKIKTINTVLDRDPQNMM